MRVTALFLCLVLISASCADLSSSTKTVNADANMEPSSFHGGCLSQSPLITEANFVQQKVRYLKSFSPEDNGGSQEDYSGTYTPPVPGEAPNDGSPEAQRLLTAWKNSGQRLQDRLCGLQWIFIEKSETNPPTRKWGWGFWENPKHQQSKWNGITGSSSYISIPYDVLKATSVAEVENVVLGLLFPQLENWKTAGVFDGPSYQETESKNGEPLVGVLAHELGHILFLANNVPDKLLTIGNCYSRSFGASWVDIRYRRFTRFGFDNDQNKYAAPNINARIDVINREIAEGISSKNFTKAARRMNVLFRGEWASALASASPVEDFVETYTLVQLMAARNGTALTSMPVLGGVPRAGQPQSRFDIVRLRNTSTTPLYAKAECVDDL